MVNYNKIQVQRVDIHHSRIIIANLRDATFGQVTEQDPGIKLIVNKTMTELRVYLSKLSMKDLRLLDLKSFHKITNNRSMNDDNGATKGGDIQFSTINLS